MPATRGVGFLGRSRERERLDAVVARAREGDSAALLVRGEAGIGKTALLRYLARQASGLRIAEIEGIQAEMELPFAGIERLCAPMLGRLEVLAQPQQNALRVAFGVAPGDAPDRFLVAVAVLNLLSSTAEQRPLMCLVDDAQWLDAVLGGGARIRGAALGCRADGDGLLDARADHDVRARRPAAAGSRRPRRARCPGSAVESRAGSARRSCPRPDHRRDRRQSARAHGALAADDTVGASRGLCATRSERSPDSARGALPAPRRRIARCNAATHAARSSGTVGRRRAAVAGGRTTLH